MQTYTAGEIGDGSVHVAARAIYRTSEILPSALLTGIFAVPNISMYPASSGLNPLSRVCDGYVSASILI